MPREFTIFGAGLSGALMAVYLARQGNRVTLYERRPDPRTSGAERGRSINLALSTRGLTALQRVGLDHEILKGAIPMRGRMIHGRDGTIAYQPYSKNPKNAINSISRAGLNEMLLDAAEREPGVTVHFGKRCNGMDFTASRAEVYDIHTKQTEWVDVAPVIAADGAFSGVRSSMQKLDRFDYSQNYLEHGYKELTITGRDTVEFKRGIDTTLSQWRVEPHALHIWPRGTYMMIALPNQDGSFTCTLFWPLRGPNSFEALHNQDEIYRFFHQEFRDAIPLIPNLVDDFVNNPTASLVTVKCWPWHVEDKAVLIGDAAHAVVPFYGQGMNASFEDCSVLADCIARHPDELDVAFDEYARTRKPNTDALAELAVENFIEMRDKTASPKFRRKKAIEHTLERFLPGIYRSLYEMVSFSNVPYAKAVARARRQEWVVKRVFWAAVVLVVVGIIFGVARMTA